MVRQYSLTSGHSLDKVETSSNKKNVHTLKNTGLCGTVAVLSANGLVGTGFASWYWLQTRATF